MIWLKLHKLEGTPFTVNMSRVDFHESDGAGRTVFIFGDESTVKSLESLEEVDDMLHVALIGNRGVVSLADIAAVVR